MSSGPDEIDAAMRRHHDRKIAAATDPTVVAEEEQVRLALSGTDLDFEHLMEKKADIIATAAGGFANGIALAEIVWGLWVDGLVVGIEVEKARP